MNVEIVIVKVEMKRNTRKLVLERDAKGHCISCGAPSQFKRQCCQRCYTAFLANMPKAKKSKEIYVAKAIANGWIGESRQGQRIKVSVYKDLAKQVQRAS